MCERERERKISEFIFPRHEYLHLQMDQYLRFFFFFFNFFFFNAMPIHQRLFEAKVMHVRKDCKFLALT